MSALPQEKPLPCQAFDDDPQVLAEVLREGVNLAVWTRRLSPALRDFAAAMVRNRPGLALSQTLEMEEERLPVLDGLLDAQQLPGQTDFLDDLGWLVEAFSCLTGARRIGLRLRVLDKPMCPRFHVDHVPLRLVTTYQGAASEWLDESGLDRRLLGGAFWINRCARVSTSTTCRCGWSPPTRAPPANGWTSPAWTVGCLAERRPKLSTNSLSTACPRATWRCSRANAGRVTKVPGWCIARRERSLGWRACC